MHIDDSKVQIYKNYQLNTRGDVTLHSFINSFIPDISIAPLQAHCYSETLSITALILCWN